LPDDGNVVIEATPKLTAKMYAAIDKLKNGVFVKLIPV
jgi:hypothetical protein